MEENKTPLTDAQIMEAVLKAIKQNANSLSIKLNLASSASIYHILKGQNKISDGMKEKIINAFPNVNYEFMSTGLGEPILNAAATQNQKNFFGIGDHKESDLMRIGRIPDMLFELIELQREGNDLQRQNNEMLKQLLDNKA